MFYYIEGVVAIIEPGLAVLDTGGVGYACYTTANTLSYLEIGQKARLYTYCNIKEDAFDIYGFYDIGEKRCFEMLISVSGVGPKAALSILSASTPEKLALAIVNDDEKALTIAPGIGKRIAQRVILELKDKVSKESALIKSVGISGVPGGTPVAKESDAAAALAVLGYTPGEIAAAMRSIDTEAMSVEDIIKAVLKNTMR
jgi:Holliday junction DNA helicase RuvA